MSWEISVSLALFAFWLTYLVRYKDCPYEVCKKFRKRFDFKPFSCFFCLSVWLYCVIFIAFEVLSFINLTVAKHIAYGLGGLGVLLLVTLFLNNLCPNEYNNDE